MDVIKDLGLSCALFGVYAAAKAASYLPPVSRRLEEKDFSMVFKAGPKKLVRYYTVYNGKLSSGRRDIPDPDLSISWASSSCLLDASMAVIRGDRTAPLQAILDGDLAVEGDIGRIYQFSKALYTISEKIPADAMLGAFSKIRMKLSREGA
ncbi:hypothetical protein [Desulfatibacillum aliphaticivorans]|uniref:SCP2 domain-containing protein n=1 Tax=Desulfatibacillum aliphaticivorans TaxID=218208 RepID=B8FLY9_DESAL|nr:hypothetical protein [Desulfatibacillum aliphaticivorans]ACL05722.1 Hypothetical protein Dalk_4037 [Desulfatibacillum aliphaticivorans]